MGEGRRKKEREGIEQGGRKRKRGRGWSWEREGGRKRGNGWKGKKGQGGYSCRRLFSLSRSFFRLEAPVGTPIFCIRGRAW